MKQTLFFITFFSVVVLSCKKGGDNNPGPGTGATTLKYSDSVFYLKSTDYTVTPLSGKTGTYTAFPDNLKINSSTGAITVTLKGTDGESQTGLRYRIKFTSGSEVDSTYITLSGVTYVDRFYYLAQNDSIISPIYNADLSKVLPAGSFSSNGGNKLALNSSNGQINVKESIRRGFFDDATNGAWKQFNIRYTLNDGSTAQNDMDVILYYYTSVNVVPSNVSALMQAHQRMTVGLTTPGIPSTPGAIDNNLSSDLSLFKPRPPCIIVIAQ
jgi:hypothetical protein